MAKNKKNKKRKKFTKNSGINLAKAIVTSSATSLSEDSIQTSLVQEVSNQTKASSQTVFYLKKDLFKIGIITFIILVIFSVTVIIDKSTSWYNQGASSLYQWLQLGK